MIMKAATSAPAMAILDTRDVTNDDVVAETASELAELLHHGELQVEEDIVQRRRRWQQGERKRPRLARDRVRTSWSGIVYTASITLHLVIRVAADLRNIPFHPSGLLLCG